MITVNLTRGGDAALDDYYAQSYAVVLIRLRGLVAMAEAESNGIAPAGTAWELYGRGLPEIAFTPRLLRLAGIARGTL